MDKKHCRGCRNDFFNSGGVAGCWRLPTAILVSRIAIGHWENPPYKNKKKYRVPICWHGEGTNRIHYIDPKKDLTAEGYWR